MPGMYVAIDGEAWQVTELSRTSLMGHGHLPVAATRYTLHRKGRMARFVVAAAESKLGISPQTHPAPPALPPCPRCNAGIGQRCDTCGGGMDARAVHAAEPRLVFTNALGQPLPEDDLAAVYGPEEADRLRSLEPPL